MEEFIKFTIEEKIGILTIDKASTLNALDIPLLLELQEKLEKVAACKEISVLVVTGTGKSFVSGANIVTMMTFNPLEAEEYGILGNKIFKYMERLEIPVIAAINGYTFGGGLELALCADIRLASSKASFAFPEIDLAIMPGFGGTQRMAALIGPSKAKELIFTCRRLNAEEALQMGVVNHVYDFENFYEEAMAYAKIISLKNPVSLIQVKSAINAGCVIDNEIGYMVENKAFAQCFYDGKAKETIGKFLEKNKKK